MLSRIGWISVSGICMQWPMLHHPSPIFGKFFETIESAHYSNILHLWFRDPSVSTNVASGIVDNQSLSSSTAFFWRLFQ